MQHETLAKLLHALPWGDSGVPKPLDAVLIPRRRRLRAIAGEPPGRLDFVFLAALGMSGWSVRTDLIQAVSFDRPLLNPVVYRRAFVRLEERGLLLSHVARVGHRPIALVRLTDRGADLLRQAGVQVVPSEWEIVQQEHRYERMTPHTAAVCIFLHHARRRGYETVPCPPVAERDLAARPDALVVRLEQPIYVEVQLRGGTAFQKAQKWRNQDRLQGFVALCAATPDLAQRLMRQAQIYAAHGLATDLHSLAAGVSGLWTHRWRSRYSPPEPVEGQGLGVGDWGLEIRGWGLETRRGTLGPIGTRRDPSGYIENASRPTEARWDPLGRAEIHWDALGESV